MSTYTLSINMAMTLDGKVTRPDGKWYGLTSKNDKKQMDVFRAEHEVLIVGKNSILNDDPIIHLRYVKGKNPLPVILLNKGSLSANKKVFNSDKKPLIFCTSENYEVLLKELSNIAQIEKLDEKEISAEKVLKKLLDLGYTKILLEGGPALNYSFLKANLVTDIYLTIVPFIIGKKDLKTFVEGENELKNFFSSPWKLESVKHVENEIFLHYKKV
ncbi:MAG: RibD family protein [Leptospiraceae bacterium]|nr:RibD family protein [Leptospiraceae bacterium]